ncbi:G5 domain-containing protein [Proteiniclasticum sp. BAD-10]|jgi:uncharacterized protein YabE (DUF348 family)/3D (Asp-Asp-Asp) domain-containing protein|uniref:G5 domain-containing protein n=1 Tax=Proteiniclasticum sediminis TaxID=2804028 RepID=A0A941CPM1_9CLOT|nr:G5 domain-containing protein [Proteiniclasticum sediminis]
MKRLFSKSVFIALFAAATMLTVVMAVNSMKKHITIVIDGKEQVIETYSETVEGVLSEMGITVAEKDKMDRSTSDVLAKNDKIEIIRAVPVELTADGATVRFMTAEKTVEAFFTAENVVVNEADIVSAAMTDAVYSGMQVSVIRVTGEVVYETQPVDFAVQEVKDSNLLKGTKIVKQEGAQGERKITRQRTYEDGILVSEVEVGNEIVKSPVDKIVAVGTKVPVVAKKPSASSIYASRGGAIPSSLSYSSSFRVSATAYAGHGVTATGTVPVRNEGGWSTIAVDRNVIPLGTRVYVEGYGYAIAEDVGGAIVGNKIDLYMNSTSAALTWGRRTVTIYILD